MNDRLENLRERERRTKIERQRNTRRSWLVALLSFLCVSLVILVGVMMSIKSPVDGLLFGSISQEGTQGFKEEIEDVDTSHGIPDWTELEWNLIVVNRNKLLPKDFTVDLAKIGANQFDYRIVEPLNEMISAAAQEGIVLEITSGFRSISEQKILYDSKLDYYAQKGFASKQSIERTLEYIQYPSASEHHTGLAVDFVTDEKTVLDESFAETEGYKWLDENAVKYGFIERYPEGKSGYTGINWEPWHYRYVGISNAKAIKSLGITLEEYVHISYNEE